MKHEILAFDKSVEPLVFHVVEAFSKKSETLAFEVKLPAGCDAQLKQIMGWSTPLRGDEGYDLSPSQAAAIEEFVGPRFYDDDHIFQLTCNFN
ncbi:hypothetical protein [Pseudomonas sp. SWRI154]|uniref:DUF7683 domain-containing protein n=1 Tax=Pseudomonas sp. SWRI154 TaxID=2745501 RepID=UPI0016493AB3|nr:hypothetical protein [Pseudomonas sp. SWRI154]MBC3364635.1 hypothetical protein [Pseudomonas sp. SWRI154]